MAANFFVSRLYLKERKGFSMIVVLQAVYAKYTKYKILFITDIGVEILKDWSITSKNVKLEVRKAVLRRRVIPKGVEYMNI